MVHTSSTCTNVPDSWAARTTSRSSIGWPRDILQMLARVRPSAAPPSRNRARASASARGSGRISMRLSPTSFHKAVIAPVTGSPSLIVATTWVSPPLAMA